MDIYSSGEDPLIKARKPYIITKQRERWTEEEHNKFLEALKLYGRAWQRIEEHIGTKTAVQIRSHAQKFFSKLEKEAIVKGTPIGEALDIDIPPPRPKRKPSNPYPRKTSSCAPTSQAGEKDGKILPSVSSLHPGNQIVDLEKEIIPEKPGGDGEPTDSKENQDDNGSDVLTLFQEGPCSSMSSVNKHFFQKSIRIRNPSTSEKLVPPTKEVINQDQTNESYITFEPNGKHMSDKSDAKQTSQTSNLRNSHNSLKKIVQCKKTEESRHPERLGGLPTDEKQAAQNYPRHVPVHILDGSPGACPQTSSPDISYQEFVFHQLRGIYGHPSLFTSIAASAPIEHQPNVPRSIHHTFPAFNPPFPPVCNNQEDYPSFLQSAFSNIIVSTLLQNPAAHAAASFAASFWPRSNVEASAESPACTQGGFPSSPMSSAPSIAAIAAATVAAASAWWAAHGLLPMCTPLHSGFPCAPESATAAPSMHTDEAPAAKTDRRENSLQDAELKDQQLEPECCEALQAQHSASKLPIASSSDSEESRGERLDIGSKSADQEKAAVETELQDSNKTKSRKLVDRSSCGSNTASSSEVETDALQNHEKDKEEPNEPDTSLPSGDSMIRRSRTMINVNESWKEVSEEGRLAFRALFTRQVLPQSFSPPQDLKNMGAHQMNNIEEDKQSRDGKDEEATLIDLNSKAWGSCPTYQETEQNAILLTTNNEEESSLTIGLGYGKLKARRTGFKPYKRCSIEAKESRMPNANSQGEEKGPKRIRLDGGEAFS